MNNTIIHYLFLINILLIISLIPVRSVAQQDSGYTNFGGIIYMDSLVVTASKTGFNASDFIDMVKDDSSFYQAFENIRLMEYESDNNIRFYEKNGEVSAGLKRKIRQYMDGRCRTMKVLQEEVTGNYYKRNNKSRYYTAKMYERIFFTYERTCHDPGNTNPSSTMDKRIAELKVLIFKPGSYVDVPVIGKKTQIFDESLRPYYNYSITSKKYKSGVDCYVFSTKLKENLSKRTQHKTIITNLETYFDKESFAVIARNYSLFYNGTLVDFDAEINIELTKVGEKYLPELLQFDGVWDIPFNKEESVQFETKFYY